MKNYKRCTRCVMDNVSDNTIKFNSNGFCNYCTDALKRFDEAKHSNKKKDLMDIICKIKRDGKEKKFDCLVGLSGGLDSAYVLYLGYQYGLRMVAIHIDDGLDSDIAKDNIKKLCKKTNTKLIVIKPKMDEYKDAILAFMKAGLPNLAIIQDNLIISELYKFAKKNKISYFLTGENLATESILQRGCSHDAFDIRHIRAIEKKFGTIKWKHLKFIGFWKKYVTSKYLLRIKKIAIIDYDDYIITDIIKELNEFCDYSYYGGKHYESILTRFMQCYYLPKKFNFDKRKSHYSSLIIDGQMKREEALSLLNTNTYIEDGLYSKDKKVLENYFSLSDREFETIINIEPRQHTDYKVSIINKFAPIARRFRRFLA